MPYDKTQRQAADIIGVHESRLSKLRSQGIIKSATRKKGKKYYYDIEKLTAELDQNLSPENRERKGKRPGEKIQTLSDEEKQKTIEKSGIIKAPVQITYGKAREMNEAYKAAIKKLEYEEKIGKLIPAEPVQRAAFDAGKKIKEQCLAIADRCHSLVAAESDPFECKQILLKEINYILEGLSKSLEVKA